MSNNPQQPSLVKKSAAETLNGISIICAVISGALWHLSTIGDGVSQLADVLKSENQWAAVFAVASAGLAFIGLLRK